jgi:hypothetical protein
MRRTSLVSVLVLGLFRCGSVASPSAGGFLAEPAPGSAASGPGGSSTDTPAVGPTTVSGGTPAGGETTPPSSSYVSGSGSVASSGSGGGSGSTAAAGAASGSVDSDASSGSAAGSGTTGADSSLADILTAGVWDDNLNFDFFSRYLMAHPMIPGDPGFLASDYTASNTQFAQRGAHTVVDAALVLDTTGSMQDEIAYLTAEFATISTAITAKFPGADQRWALVVYRDTPDTDPGDDYVVKSFDFTGSVSDFSTLVGQQTAANGGDYPESPEIGIEQMMQLTWRTDPSVAKIAFWVADAPQHSYRAAAMKQAISDAHAKGIHMYPVSASGTDDLLELTMRTAAEITGGRYIFLTDDSGVGDPHKIPEIPCYYVTKLQRAIVRAVSMELSGTYMGPDAADVIRTSGSPASDGTCMTQDGQTVRIF